MTETQFAMVSEWMTNGNINQFVTLHQDANRFELVSFRSESILVSNRQLRDFRSWGTSREVWLICTAKGWFMGI